MTDLGFGLADRRSVVVILFTFVMANALFANPIPVDTTSAATIFVSLVVLTGFIYFVRSICRLALLFVFYLVLVPIGIYYEIRNASTEPKNIREVIHDAFAFYAVEVQDWYNDWVVDTFLKVDRALLIAVAFVATLPSLPISREIFGLAGLGLLVLVYVFTGRFTFILKDALQQTEEEREELVTAAKNPNFPSSIYTEPKPREYG